jgi:hypothetical protein
MPGSLVDYCHSADDLHLIGVRSQTQIEQVQARSDQPPILLTAIP